MVSRAMIPVLVFLAGMMASYASGDEYNLYKPEKVEKPKAPDNPGDGVLVRTITIRKGDTLWKLSRKYGEKSSYFSQILLFNKISKPDRIYAGKKLRVPVIHPGQSEKVADGKKKEVVLPPSGSAQGIEKQAKPAAPPVGAADNAAQLFEKGVNAFNENNYSAAIELFEEFMSKYPDSPYMADAALYSAEAYQSMSGSE